jgi:MalT-like TPR region
MGVLLARAGDLERARSVIGQAVALFEETDDTPGQMGMRLNLGNIAFAAGEHESARRELEAGRDMAVWQRLYRCTGWATLTLAELAIADGDLERATRLVEEAHERLRPLGDRWGVARCLELDEAVAKR